MKVTFKHEGSKHTVQFRVSTSRYTDIITIAKTSKDLDILHPLRKDGDRPIQEAIKQVIEKKLNLRMIIDHNYSGAGFGFGIDMYTMIDRLK